MDALQPDGLYPDIVPFDSGRLAVPGGHELYYEQCGAPHGIPAVVLHGGPGSGCSPRQRRYFDPGCYRLVLFDQRGSGRSSPLGETRHNHTAELVADIDRLRSHLGIERWLVFGGSWGSTLAAAYAAAHKSSCAGVLMRGTFLAGSRDLDWFFGGAACLFPQEWERFAEVAPRRHRRNLLHWLARSFEGGDTDTQGRAAAAWQAWELCLGGSPPVEPPAGEALNRLVAKYRVQSHYLVRRCFLGEARVLRDISLLHGLPVAFVHGRLDFVCRPENAWRAHRTLSGSRLIWVDGAGHDPFHPEMARALVRATDGYAMQGDFGEVVQ